MPTFRKYTLPGLVLLLSILLAGCDTFGQFGNLLPSPATQSPPPTPGPTRTPLPASPLGVVVRLPANTPPGGSVTFWLLDFVAGAHRAIPMTPGPNGTWQTALNLPAGSFIQYRYTLNTADQVLPETTLAGEAVSYRVFHSSAGQQISDTVAAWHGLNAPGGSVGLTGVVHDSLTGDPIPGVIVSAGGRQTVSGHDGSYVILGLPPGQFTVTGYVPDGRWRTLSQSVVVPQGTARVDVPLLLARAVRVTFIATPPAGVLAQVPFYLAGNVRQLGDTLRVQPGGSTIVASRQQRLTLLEDGRLSLTVSLFEGQQFNYRYTLGNGQLNGELYGDHTPLVRTLVIPGTDLILQEAIGPLEGMQPPASFSVVIPGDTPPDNGVSLQLNLGGVWQSPLPMWPLGDNNYFYILYNPMFAGEEIGYRFCRNMACEISPDAAHAGDQASGYRLTPNSTAQAVNLTVNGWQWWGDIPSYPYPRPAPLSRPGMVQGVGLPVSWDPASQPRIPATFDRIGQLSANTIRIPVVWELAANGEVRFDPAQSITTEDLVEQIRAAHDRGLQVALLPLVRPALDGPYAGDADLFWTIQGQLIDAQWWGIWFASYRRFILTQARLAEFYGVEYFYIGEPGLSAALPGEAFAPGDALDRWRALIGDVRQVYLRPIVFQMQLAGRPAVFRFIPPAFLDSVDIVDINWQVGLSDSDTPDIPSLENAALAVLDAQVAPLVADNRQLWLSLRYPAVNRSASQCITLNSNDCLPLERFEPVHPFEPALPIDMTEQATIYEAMLEVIDQHDWIRGVFSDGYQVAVITRDMGISVHGKPAEQVLRLWFEAWSGG